MMRMALMIKNIKQKSQIIFSKNIFYCSINFTDLRRNILQYCVARS